MGLAWLLLCEHLPHLEFALTTLMWHRSRGRLAPESSEIFGAADEGVSMKVACRCLAALEASDGSKEAAGGYFQVGNAGTHNDLLI